MSLEFRTCADPMVARTTAERHGDWPAGEACVRTRDLSLPPLLWWVLAGAALNYLNTLVPGLRLPVADRALGWLVPLAAALWYLVRGGRVAFPLWIWLPWVLWVTWYAAGSADPHALQRTVMLVTPLLVGTAVSGLVPWRSLPAALALWLRRYAVFLLVAAGVGTGVLQAGRLGGPTGFITGAMTATLLSCWFAARAATGGSRELLWWGGTASIPFLALTRMPMLAALASLPFTLAPLKASWRAVSLAAIVLIGGLLFQSERVQAKMFYSGRGTVRQALDGMWALVQGEGTGDFRTTGRWPMNRALLDGIARSPWLGHGANASEAVVKAFGGMGHPHNDWLRFGYDYGLVSVFLLCGAVVGQVCHAIRTARGLGHQAAVWLWAGASAYIPMCLLMVSDNVMLYASSFGNLQCMMLGFGYALARVDVQQRPSRYRVS